MRKEMTSHDRRAVSSPDDHRDEIRMSEAMSDMITGGGEGRSGLPKWLLLAILFIALAALMASHLGAHSPYTYVFAIFNLGPIRHYGMLVNPDARYLLPVTQFFYEPRSIAYASAYNLKLPMHSFLAATGEGLTHSYLAGTLSVNFLLACLVVIAAVNLADQAGISRRATLVAGLTFFSLPLWAHYIGQPMQYTVASSINFLIMLTALALARKGIATPATFGILTALLALNYDWYVFATALFLYAILSGVLRTVRHYAVYFATAITPVLLWHVVLRLMTSGRASSEIGDRFIVPVVTSWLSALRDFRVQPLTAFVVTSVGLRLGITEVMALLYWPLIVACCVALFYYRGNEDHRLIALIVFVYGVEQAFTAAYEWENNPRRAIPVVFAFGVAYAVAVNRTMTKRTWRFTWLFLLGMTLVFSYADRLVLAPAITYLDSGEATRGLPKDAIVANNRILTRDEMPRLETDDDVRWAEPGRAVIRDSSKVFAFGVAQLGVFAMMCGVLTMASRAALLPRWSAAVFTGVWVVSLITRWI
jgi:hypothetical protein